MLDLRTAFADFAFDVEVTEPVIDRAFIAEFLTPYFRNMPREELEAKIAEIISREIEKLAAADRPRG